MPMTIPVPTQLIIESGAIYTLRDRIAGTLLDNRRVFVISGSGPTQQISERLLKVMSLPAENIKNFACKDNEWETVTALEKEAVQHASEIIIGVGGGKVLDVSKTVATRMKVPLILLPTAISCDAMCSTVAAICVNKSTFTRIEVNMPDVVVIDLDILASCPPRLLSAGIGDLLSNKTALFDWNLAHQANQEKMNSLAYIIANSAVETFMNTINTNNFDRVALLRVTAESLVMSGIAMSVAGSSRPCSGSEHLISHALDYYCGGKALHGEQVAIGYLIAEHMQGTQNTENNLRQYYNRLGLPTHYRQLGYTRNEMRYAVQMARSIRDRYTILNEYELTERQIDRMLDEVFQGA